MKGFIGTKERPEKKSSREEALSTQLVVVPHFYMRQSPDMFAGKSRESPIDKISIPKTARVIDFCPFHSFSDIKLPCFPTAILILPSFANSSRIGFRSAYLIPTLALNLAALHLTAIIGQYPKDLGPASANSKKNRPASTSIPRRMLFCIAEIVSQYLPGSSVICLTSYTPHDKYSDDHKLLFAVVNQNDTHTRPVQPAIDVLEHQPDIIFIDRK